MTAAATVATAPLMAHHFDSFSLAALPANLLALPAVAPAMWLGMLAGIAGQLLAFPVEPLNWLNSLCLAYIAQIAHWLATPTWSMVKIPLRTPLSVVGAYAGVIAAIELLLAAAKRRDGMVLRQGRGGRRGALRRMFWRGKRAALRASLPLPAVVLLGLAAAVAAVALFWPHDELEAGDPDNLMVRVLDVGQGTRSCSIPQPPTRS